MPVMTPSRQYLRQPAASWRRNATISPRVMTDAVSRPATTVAGETSSTPILMNMNDAPQMSASANRTAYSRTIAPRTDLLSPQIAAGRGISATQTPAG